MSPKEVTVAVQTLGHNGTPIDCTRKEYHAAVRVALQDAAGKWIDTGQAIRAQIALSEVQRLDKKYGAFPDQEPDNA